jgi:two-component system nitrogen regulation response regulator GlnG
VIKRALALASGEVITEEDVSLATDRDTSVAEDWTGAVRRELAAMLDDPESTPERGPYWSLVERVERAVLVEALERAQGNQLRAAQLLGINRNTLRKKLGELGIESRPSRGGSR